MQSPSGSRGKSEEDEEEMKESGVDLSYDMEAPDVDSSPVPMTKAISSSGQRTPSIVKHKQTMRFQAKLLLLKQKHEQNFSKDEFPQRTRKSPLSSTTFKSTKLPQFAETAGMATHVIDSRRIVTNPSKYQIITSSPLCSQYSVSDPSLDSLGSPLTSPPDQQMKFNIPPQSFSSDVGYVDNASPDSNVTSSSDLSEGDNLFLANVVEVKALDEITVEQQEELSQILSQASYGSEGITGLLQGDSNNRVGLTSSSSCPVVTQPRYRGGRKKEEAPPNMTPEQRVQWEKERQKKDNHNHIERRRRDKINECIRLLSHIVPNGEDLSDVDTVPVEVGNSDSQKKEYNKKGAVLEASVNYIKRLQSEHRNLDELRQRQAVLERENRRLQLLVQQMTLEAEHRQHESPHLTQNIQVQQQALLQPYQQQHGQLHVQQVEVPLGPSNQHQPNLQMIYNQQRPQQVEMLLTTNQQLPMQVPIQDQHLLEELMNLVQSSECPIVASNGQFEPFTELIFQSLPEENFPTTVISNHFDDANAMDFSMDDMFTDGSSLQLNSDPLLSTTNSIPDFEEDIFSRLMAK